jgi:acetoin utilization transport system permease protein
MFHKALWIRNQKLASPAVWAIYLVLFFFLPVPFYGKAQEMQTMLERYSTNEYQVGFNFFGAEIAIFLVFIVIGMASLLIGQERTTHSTDLTFSLPFKRRDIFLSKWLFGVIHITTSLLLNLLLCMAIVEFTILSEIVRSSFILQFMIIVIPFSIAIFTFSMFIGTIAGSVVSQFILSAIFIYFPIGFFSLLTSFLTYHGLMLDPMHNIDGSMTLLSSFITNVTLPLPIYEFNYYTSVEPLSNNYLDRPSYFALLSPLIYLAITLPAGVWLFNRTKNENNGKLLVFDKGKGFFTFGVILCFALAGGAFGGEMFGSYEDPSLTGYYLSAAVGGVLSYLVLRKLINIQLRFSK